MGVDITGIDEALSMLSEMADSDHADAVTMRALKIEAKKIQSAAKLLCPVDTGRLRRSITVEDIPTGVSVGTNVEYAEYVEYGTGGIGDQSVSHTTKEYWRYQDDNENYHTSRGRPPRPFMAPAYEAYKNDIAENVKEYVVRSLNNNG